MPSKPKASGESSQNSPDQWISLRGVCTHNLKSIDVDFPKNKLSVVVGVSGSGKSSLAFDTLAAEAKRQFHNTLSFFERQFVDNRKRSEFDSMSGLQPAVDLAQIKTNPGSYSRVGSFIDYFDLLGTLLAGYGEFFCPKHGQPLSQFSKEKFARALLDQHKGEHFVFYSPVVRAKKGNFSKELERLEHQGFLDAIIDGKEVELSEKIKLNPNKKHSIKIVVDEFKISTRSKKRLTRAIDLCLTHGHGYGQYQNVGLADQDAGEEAAFVNFGGTGTCRECGYSPPKLDSRYFSPSSLGACLACEGKEGECESCDGLGLDFSAFKVKYGDKSLEFFYRSDLSALHEFFTVRKSSRRGENMLLEELTRKLDYVTKFNLGYLAPFRFIKTLSLGELQRLRISNILVSEMRDLLFVIDEPSQGLDAPEINILMRWLRSLTENNCTVILVDHRQSLVQQCDYLVELGPGGGEQGGKLIFQGPMEKKKGKGQEGISGVSDIEYHLREARFKEVSPADAFEKNGLILRDLHKNNLSLESLFIQFCGIHLIRGPSGAGKSSLLEAIADKIDAYRQANKKQKNNQAKNQTAPSKEIAIKEMVFITERQLGKSKLSMPISVLKVFKDLRELFAKLPSSQISGMDASHYSLTSKKGRCLECEGRGTIKVQMRYVDDFELDCSTCLGRRYSSAVLLHKYKGKSIDEILNLTFSQAGEFFQNHSKIATAISHVNQLGLGYLTLGQSNSSLSGGEAKRLKIAAALNRKTHDKYLYILDEPSIGLHTSDILRLANALVKLKKSGATILLADNSLDFLEHVDRVLGLGPGSGRSGGRLVYQMDKKLVD